MHTLEFKIERSIISMSKRGKVVTCLILAMVMIVSCVPLFASAAARSMIVDLPSNQRWSISYNAGYDSASARLLSVYPLSGEDNFTRIQCQAVTRDGDQISSIYTLTEGASASAIKLYQGMQDPGFVYFRFRGNADYAAQAVVEYSATYY